MDAVLSFFRDTRNSMICAVLFLFFAAMYVFGWLAERVLHERPAHLEAPALPAARTTSAPPVAPPPVAPEPLDPTILCISPYWLPDEPAELHALVDGLPEGTPIKLGDDWFTAGEIAALAKVWARVESGA